MGDSRRDRHMVPHSPTPPTTSVSEHLTQDGATGEYRVVVFGTGGVGKTAIVRRFVNKTFNEGYLPTVEDTYQVVINCNQKNVCTLQIVDTTGTHQFPAMQKLSMARGHAFIIVYSIASKQSLEDLGPIVLALRETKGEQISDTPVMLVGNKKDEGQKREVSVETGKRLADKWSCGFIETSAKANENIMELFQNLLVLERRRQLALGAVEDNYDAKKEASKRRCSIM